MIRTILLLLALVVLIGVGLVYMGILHWPGAGEPVQVRPAEVKMETRQVNVQVPVVTTPADQPAQQPPAGNTAQPTP